MSQHWPAYTVERWPIDRLKPYERNARRHSDRQVEQLRGAMRAYGWTVPILAREDGTLIAGHGRLEAGLAEGFTEVPVIVARGWSDEQCRAYALADNRIALNAEWDTELLGGELADLDALGIDLASLGFAPQDLAALGIGVAEGEMPLLSSSDRPSFQQMTFTVHDSQVAPIKAAIDKAKAAGPFEGPNENSNGNALARICSSYAER